MKKKLFYINKQFTSFGRDSTKLCLSVKYQKTNNNILIFNENWYTNIMQI